MFHHPAWAVGSYSSGPPAARSAGTKSTGGFPRPLGPPCIAKEIPHWVKKAGSPNDVLQFILFVLLETIFKGTDSS